MNGQTTLFNEKQKMVDDYVKKVDLYGDYKPFKFDLRGYARYIEEHSIPRNNVPKEIMDMFDKS